MKLVIALIATSLTVTQSFAVTKMTAGSDPHGCGYRNCGLIGTSVACAPEVIHGNMSATERALTELSNGPLSSALKFKAKVEEARTLQESERMDVYLKLVGVQNDADVVEFITEREVSSKYIESLKVNADLNEEQARLVINKISASLLGQQK